MPPILRQSGFCSALALGLCLAAASALGQSSNLTHRYTFNGTANDSVGTANGTLRGGAVITNDALLLNGASGTYLSLPAGLVTGYTAITIEAWVTDNGSSPWARIFDFGNNTTTNMFLSLPSGYSSLRGAYTTNGSGSEQRLEWSGNRPPAWQEAQIAWTTDGATHTGVLYVDGLAVATNSSMTLTPASLGRTTNNWVGRSQYSNDPYFKGSINELRIYSAALSASAIRQDYLDMLPPSVPVTAQACVEGDAVLITFNCVPPRWYVVQCSDSLNPPAWQDLFAVPKQATEQSMTCVHVGGAMNTQMFYRVVQFDYLTNRPPVVTAGVDRDVIVGGNTYLSGSVQDDGNVYATPITTWSMLSGLGTAMFSNANALTTTASFSDPGPFILQLVAFDGQYPATNTLNVTVASPLPATHPLPVYVAPYAINSRLWTYRLNKTLTNWIPHLYAKLNDTNLAEGGIGNFIQAGNKLAGRSYSAHVGPYPFEDAYTLNTVESMCYALMYDAQGDSGVLSAQAAFQTNLSYWIPIILGAQESDGYLHTWTTLRGGARWSDNTLHEGYVAGYFLEAGLAHYLMSGCTDATLYNAAKKMADCWYTNLYVPRKLWFDGHENMEQALVHLGRFVNEFEGAGTGQKYIDLAKYLMDMRGTPAANAALHDGGSYDQSHLPSIQQYEAAGHAVRAVYLYSGIADVAIETGNVDYQSAALSLFDNFVNKKYYVQGGAGSGETSEGFGNNYSLRNNAYNETCAGCGTLFFFQKMNLGYQDAKYADLMENVLYNEVLGSLDDQANNIFYPNPLNSSATRYSWTSCPCCYGNTPRVLFQMPTWIYARSADTIYVNLFVGSTVSIPDISGTTVQMVQTTEYPWTNTVSIVVNPSTPTNFTLNLRVPNRTMSALYTPTPAISGLTSLQLNGSPLSPTLTNGYATITRTWTAGDRVDLELPLAVQRIKASSKIAADVGLVALQYGPLIYNVESVDQNISTNVLNPGTTLSTAWTNNLLGGLMLITGNWTNGAPLTAIPNYARLNRGGSTAVWLKDQ